MSFKIKKVFAPRAVFDKKYVEDKSQKSFLLSYVGDGEYEIYEEVTTYSGGTGLSLIGRQHYSDLLTNSINGIWKIHDEKPKSQ